MRTALIEPHFPEHEAMPAVGSDCPANGAQCLPDVHLVGWQWGASTGTTWGPRCRGPRAQRARRRASWATRESTSRSLPPPPYCPIASGAGVTPVRTSEVIDSGLVRSTALGGVPREQKMLKGHLTRVIHHRVYYYTKIIRTLDFAISERICWKHFQALFPKPYILNSKP